MIFLLTENKNGLSMKPCDTPRELFLEVNNDNNDT